MSGLASIEGVQVWRTQPWPNFESIVLLRRGFSFNIYLEILEFELGLADDDDFLDVNNSGNEDNFSRFEEEDFEDAATSLLPTDVAAAEEEGCCCCFVFIFQQLGCFFAF